MIKTHRIGQDITPRLNRDLLLCAGKAIQWEKTEDGLHVFFEAGKPDGGFRASGLDDLAYYTEQPGAPDITPTSQTFQVTFSFPYEGILRVSVGRPGQVRYARQTERIYPFTVSEEDRCICLAAAGYRLMVDKNSQLFSLSDPEGKTVVSQSVVNSIYWGYQAPPLSRLNRDGQLATVLSLTRQADESYYGFGEQFTDLDKRNQVVEIENMDPANTLSAGSYVNIPFFLSTNGYGLMLDTPRKSRFDMGSRTMAGISIEVEGEDLDMYLLSGSMKAALAKYYQLTGSPSLTPAWSFGIWMSSLPTYNSSENVLEVARTFRSRNFPCDVLHIDPVWMGQKTLVCDFEWGPAFSDPAVFIRQLKELGFKLSLWISPYVPLGSAMHDEGLAHGFFVCDGDGAVLVNEGAMNFWSVPFSYIDFTHPDAAAWYREQVHRLLSDGADIIKNDLGELAPPEAVYHDGTLGYEGHNRYSQLYADHTYKACQEFFGEDAIIWSRSGYIGAAKTPCHWAGDVPANYENMRGQLRAVLGAGLGGFVFFSHDTGGFNGNPTPELYARWFQMGCFTSHMRAHGCFHHEPWHYGDRVYQICLDYARLRYTLLPTLYSAAAECCEAGRPMAAALVLEYQDDQAVRSVDDEYLFADSLLVCPVFAGDTRRRVYLPRGSWFDFYTGQHIEGGQYVEVACPLERLPLYVKDRSILFTSDVRNCLTKGEMDWGRVEARVYSAQQSGQIKRRLYTAKNQYRDIVIEIHGKDCTSQEPDIAASLASRKD